VRSRTGISLLSQQRKHEAESLGTGVRRRTPYNSFRKNYQQSAGHYQLIGQFPGIYIRAASSKSE